MVFCCYFKKTLIFQCELKKKVARSNRQEQRKKKNSLGKGAYGPECRYQEKSANAEADDRQEHAGPTSQELLEPGVLKFVGQQNLESLWGVDQVAERAVCMSGDQRAPPQAEGGRRTKEVRKNLARRDVWSIFIMIAVLRQPVSFDFHPGQAKSFAPGPRLESRLSSVV